MLISAIEINDYKRVRKVAITPAADTHVVLLGGKNMQGKTSVLEALAAAFGGSKEVLADPVRHGAKEASIFVKLDDGAGGTLTIDRTVEAGTGKTKLEVRNADGPVRAPQAMLDKLIGTRFLDPLAFLQLAPKEQRAQLMRVIPAAARIDELDAKKKSQFDRRTEIGRDLTKAEGELARLPAIDDPGTPVDVAKLTAEMRPLADAVRLHAEADKEFAAAVRAVDTHTAAQQRAEEAAARLEAQAEQLMRDAADQRQIAGREGSALQAAIEIEKVQRERLETATTRSTEATKRRDEIEAELARADAHNREVIARETQIKRREETAATVAKLKADRETCTVTLGKIEARKAEILTSAKLPVEGLAIGDDGIMLAGVPFEQASGAEKLRVALAIAIAASPGLDDVWVRDAAILDDEQLAIIAEHAAKAGKRVWLERIGTRDPGVIEIRDGEVVA